MIHIGMPTGPGGASLIARSGPTPRSSQWGWRGAAVLSAVDPTPPWQGSAASRRALRMDRLRQLLYADEVARRVADRAVAGSPWRIGLLLDDLDVRGLQPLEGAIKVVAAEEDHGIGAFGHHLADGAALVVGDARIDSRRRRRRDVLANAD